MVSTIYNIYLYLYVIYFGIGKAHYVRYMACEYHVMVENGLMSLLDAFVLSFIPSCSLPTMSLLEFLWEPRAVVLWHRVGGDPRV